MVDVLIISLPTKWDRNYVYVENYWLVLFSQYIASHGFKTLVMDIALKKTNLNSIIKNIKEKKPKVLIYLVTKKNSEIVYKVKSVISEQSDIKCILLWDDTVTLLEANNIIPESDYSLNIQLSKLLETVCKLTNQNVIYMKKWTKEILLSGRSYLQHILLEGGECEVLGKFSRRMFPNDYNFLSDACFEVQHDFVTLLYEIEILCKKYQLRKINIIDDCLKKQRYLQKIFNHMEKVNLFHVKLGLYINVQWLTDDYYDFIIKNKQWIYKTVIYADILNKKQINLFKKLMKHNIKVKVIFKLFHEKINKDYVYLIMGAIQKNNMCISPMSLISGVTTNEYWLRVQRIMTYFYYNIFKSYHEKIITVENNRKYLIRLGYSKDYASLLLIQEETEKLTRLINQLFFNMFQYCIKYTQIDNEKKLILKLLEKYKDKLYFIEGEINACLLDSFRI